MNEKASSSSKSAFSPAKKPSVRPRTSAGIKFVLGLALFIGLTTYAFLQPTKPDPLSVPTAWESFFYPQERNAFLKLPAIAAGFNKVFALRETGLVWAVGDQGFILHSRDGGESWEQQTFSGGPLLEPADESTEDQSIGFFNGILPISSAVAQSGYGGEPDDKDTLRQQYLQQQQIQQQVPASPTNVYSDNQNLAGTIDVPPDSDEEQAQIEEYEQFLEQEQWQEEEPPILTEAPAAEPSINQTLPPDLLSVHFIDASTGFITGSGGTLLKTENGGQQWQRVESNTREDIHSITFDTERNGLAMSANSVLKTRDGGENWEISKTLTLDPIGTDSWNKQYLAAVKFVDINTAVAVTNDGYFQTTTNSGESWNWSIQPARKTPTTLPTDWFDFATNIEILDLRTAVATGFLGRIFKTSDSGNTWKQIPQTNIANGLDDTFGLSSSAFYDHETGFAVGANGLILKTADAGENWQLESISDSLWASSNLGGLESASFIDANTVIIAGYDGSILRTNDGGESWHSLTAPILTVAQVSDSKTLLITDELGNTLESSDEGRSWKPTSANEITGNMQPGEFNVALSLEGIESTLEAIDGENWQTQSIRTQTNLNATARIKEGSAIIVGDHATLLKTIDNGATWFVPYDDYRRSPALWYWLVCAIFALLGIRLSTRRPVAETETTKSIEDILASDRPLEPGDPDPLEFGAIARGLSRFMRNPSTEPPLTVAVTGAWGTGKSSLMNLLHHDLKKYGFTPVWFNAWHHQKGEQLLASLYSNIRNQAIPGLFKFNGLVPVGLLFRINLLFRRSIKHWLVTLLLITLFIAAATYLIENPSGLDELSIEDLLAAFSEADNIEKLMVLLFGNLAPLAALFRGMRAFGLNPTNLIALGADNNDSPNRVDPGARQQFAREFNEVTQCLELGRMVIFIDDLDRCSKENVVDILESINFLSVSGDCYIVLGMDEGWVKVCIEQQFPEMAKKDSGQVNHEFAENYLEKMVNIKVPVPTLEAEGSGKLLAPELPDSAPPSKFEQLFGWAKQQIVRYRYLTLISAICVLGIGAGRNIDNWLIEAPEPGALPTEEQQVISIQTWDNVNIEQLDMSEGQPSFRISVNSTNPDDTEAYTDLQLELLATEEDIQQGVVIGRFGDSTASASLVLKQPSTWSSETEPGTDTDLTPTSDTDTPPASEKAPEFNEGQTSKLSMISYWLPGLAVLAFLAGIVAYSMKRPERIVRDSSEFRDALSIWHPWIMFNRQTPRAIKRYLNRVRYMAMRYREEPEPTTEKSAFLTRLTTIFGISAKKSGPQAEESFIKEPSLVALSAIFALDESWLIDPEKFELIQNGQVEELLGEKFNNFLIKMEGDTSVAQKHIQALAESLVNHRNKFGDDIFDIVDARAKFLKVMAVTEFS